MKITLNQLKRLIKEVVENAVETKQEFPGTGSAATWSPEEFSKIYPKQYSNFLTQWEDEDAGGMPGEPVEGTFHADEPRTVTAGGAVHVPSSARVVINGKKKILTYIDDNVAWAWCGPSIGWDSFD